MADPTTAVATGLIGKILGEIGKAIKDPALKKIAEWGTPAKMKEAGKKLSQYELVKTLSNPEKPQRLHDFYLPPKFSYNEGVAKNFNVDQIENFGIENFPLIEGIAGQGKSMFMRHLFLAELCLGERLPILIELRKN